MFLGSALLLTGGVLAAYLTDVFGDTELDTVDARFAIRGDQPPPEDVVVVGVDDGTFSELDEQWPFKRSRHGQLIDCLRDDGARAIVYDVQFTEPTKPAEDNALLDSVERAGNVVLATTEVDKRGGTNVFGGDDVVRQVRARAASANYLSDSGRVVRRMEYDVEGLETLAVAAVERGTGRARRRVEAAQTPAPGYGGPWVEPGEDRVFRYCTRKVQEASRNRRA